LSNNPVSGLIRTPAALGTLHSIDLYRKPDFQNLQKTDPTTEADPAIRWHAYGCPRNFAIGQNYLVPAVQTGRVNLMHVSTQSATTAVAVATSKGNGADRCTCRPMNAAMQQTPMADWDLRIGEESVLGSTSES
jgi:hypothetical protein